LGLQIPGLDKTILEPGQIFSRVQGIRGKNWCWVDVYLQLIWVTNCADLIVFPFVENFKG